MKIVYYLAFFVFIMFCLPHLFSGCNNVKKFETGEMAVQHWYQQKADSLIASLDVLNNKINKKDKRTSLQQQFSISRQLYKKIEPIIEYYFQGLNKRINGPALPDVKTDDNQVWPPHGFQVIEQYLFAPETDSLQVALENEIKLLQTDLRFTKANLVEQAILPRHVNELIQHEVIRIAVLGITGFDAPLSKLSLEEAIASIAGLEELVIIYTQSEKKSNTPSKELLDKISKAKKYLKENADFDSFNRMFFIQEYLIDFSKAFDTIPIRENIADSVFAKPFKGGLHTLFKGNKFNPDYYASYAVAASNLYKIQLGKKLFKEKLLSQNKTISCRTCHQPELFFTDGLKKATNFVHGGNLGRNTPTLYYSSIQAAQFYDMRSTTLEDQVHEVMKNSEEFNLNSAVIAKNISNSSAYKPLIKQAFAKDSITGFEIRNALAAYIRSLNPFSSRFDEYMRGNKTAMSNEEVNGFNLFAGKAKCATCHFVPVFNGTIPPWYAKSESEIIGVPEKSIWQKAKIDNDSGRYKLNQLKELLYSFKTPTVRNAAKTAPYMHNGVYKTLNEVIDFYHKGGGVGIGIDLPFQSLPFDSLSLNSKEKKELISFLQALTDYEKN